MRIGNLSGRLNLFTDGGAVDVAEASGGRFSPDPQAIYDVWDDFAGWASTLGQVDATDFQLTDLQAPTPAPAQVFAIGLNYRDHGIGIPVELRLYPALPEFLDLSNIVAHPVVLSSSCASFTMQLPSGHRPGQLPPSCWPGCRVRGADARERTNIPSLTHPADG